MYKTALLVFQTFILILIPIYASAQECQPPKVIFNDNTGNIFSEEQEMYLGEAIAEQVQKDFRVLEDEAINGYVRRIGNRIAGHLPPTEIKFQFYVVDIPDVNAFAFAGGRIYVTRKLIAFVRNEDELAGVIAHELGHAIVRHSAVDMSRNFREILGVETVGGRDDVFAKYNELIDKRNTKRLRGRRSHEGKQQLEADQIGVFAMTAAGYDPNAFTSAFDRIAGTEGNTGSWFSDLFGATTSGEKRLREIIDAVKQMPAGCISQNAAKSSEDFEAWRTQVIAFSGYGGKERIYGLIGRKALNPTLRDSIDHLEFSRDGKYIVAQDDSSIYVLQREPFKFLFRIDSADSNNATFSPDSKTVVFHTPGMRVEKWSIADRKPVSIREVFINRECFQTAISSDGDTFACFSLTEFNKDLYVDFKLSDLRTNETIIEKERFFRPHPLDFIRFLTLSRFDDETKMFQTEFSPDGRYFVTGRVFKREARTQPLPGGGGFVKDVKAGSSGMLGYDLLQRKEIEIGDKLRDIIVSPFTFVDADRIVGQDRAKEENSGIFEFPTGKQQEKFTILGDSFSKSHKGNYVIVRPLKTAPVGVYDLTQKKLIITNKTPAFAVYEDVFVSENKTGELGLFSLTDDKQLATLELPESRFGSIRTLNLSPDLNWLAVSDRDRGAVWSLYSGNRVFFVQGFREAFFNSDGKIYADFARTEQTKRQVAVMDLRTQGFVSSREVETPNTTQYGSYLVTLKQKSEKDEDKKKPDKITPERIFDDYFSSFNPRIAPQKDGVLEVRDVRTDQTLWSREFPKEIPGRYFSPVNETVTLVWQMKSDAARDVFRKDERLGKMAGTMGDKEGDYYVEVLEAATGKVVGQTLIETGEGSFRIRRVEAAGDWLVVNDSENRVMFYSLTDGELKQRFFGSNFTVNKQNNTVAVGNLSGQIVIYSLDTGRAIRNMSFDSPIAYAQFDKYGKKLFVLTTKQEAFMLDPAKFAAADNPVPE